MENQKFYYLLFTTIAILSLILLGAGMFFSAQKNDIALQSSLVLSPSPVVSPTMSAEPLVFNWKNYENTAFHFSMQVPAEWKMQDYTKFYTNGGTQIAFSPGDLPCGSCSYFRDGYMSVKIYNESTDPISYSDFQVRMKNIGKSAEFAGVKIDGITGVMHLTTIAIEKDGWIYEFALDENKGKSDIAKSDIFQKSVSSFQFTTLKFEK